MAIGAAIKPIIKQEARANNLYGYIFRSETNMAKYNEEKNKETQVTFFIENFAPILP